MNLCTCVEGSVIDPKTITASDWIRCDRCGNPIKDTIEPSMMKKRDESRQNQLMGVWIFMNSDYCPDLLRVAIKRFLDPPENLVSLITRQMKFSQTTFGPAPRVKGISDHIRKELDEIAKAPTDLTEWADVIILALDGAWRAGHTPEAIAKAIYDKLIKNESRQWPDWRQLSEHDSIEHIRKDGE